MLNTKINFNKIRELIPHREPFLFLDELVDIVKLKKATGIKTFAKDEWRFEGNSYDESNNAICEAKWSAMIMDRNNEQDS